ncbi:hypothetical protein PVIIG_04619 [Plasmodium vivax India VII]|uniref:Uncharacterized protein n=2 Tax=Plasmodium vivax TaxID=5855 RepID=A0A0J9V9Y7_PLAVI|nr:hypothetical protein PVIIG_04619 [Plasmodium vivax India VII]
MEDEIFGYVKEFPNFESVISAEIKESDWIYKEVISKNGHKYNELINHFFDNIGNLEKCEDHTKSIDKNIHKKLQILYKLYENFKKFKEETSKDSSNCKSGKLCAQEYETHEGTCKGNGNNSFCNELENFRVLFNNHLKSKNKCDNIEELPSFQGPSLAATISLPVTLMSAISFFSFITYKYTPLGSWINPKLVKKKRTINELLHESENRENISNMRQYNIAYNLS